MMLHKFLMCCLDIEFIIFSKNCIGVYVCSKNILRVIVALYRHSLSTRDFSKYHLSIIIRISYSLSLFLFFFYLNFVFLDLWSFRFGALHNDCVFGYSFPSGLTFHLDIYPRYRRSKSFSHGKYFLQPNNRCGFNIGNFHFLLLVFCGKCQWCLQ